MIKNERLEIKIAVVKNGIEHQKTGILGDADGQVLSFIGSDNETVKGWLHNDEIFHVFCNWKDGDRDHLTPDISRFDRLWSDKGIRVRVYRVSDAFRQGLIRNAPRSDEAFERLSRRATERLLREHSKDCQASAKRASIKLRDYQREAIEKWLENGRRGIFEMATGTGKTFTALGCVKYLLEKEKKLVVIITTPYGHLSQQWQKEIVKFGLVFDRLLVVCQYCICG